MRLTYKTAVTVALTVGPALIVCYAALLLLTRPTSSGQIYAIESSRDAPGSFPKVSAAENSIPARDEPPAPGFVPSGARDQLPPIKVWPSVSEVSCSRLLAGDPAEQQRAIGISYAAPLGPDHRPDAFYAGQGCPEIRRGFVTQSLSEEEAGFPVAFGLIVFKEFYQVEKLFRAVYRPEHYYCFHVDSKATGVFYRAVKKYAGCFRNVAVAERRIDVAWGRFSVLEAELVCMETMLRASKRWLYYINLTGQEYPLRTMLELVQILKAMNGSNNMENAGARDTIAPMEIRLPDGSKNQIQWHKGSVHITATRGFVQFALSETGSQISEHLRKFARLPCADETFFPTLNNNWRMLKVPGADKTGLLTDNVRQPFFNRYKNWLYGVFGYPCLSGKIVRQICIWGVADLPAMNRRFEFFVNKFYHNYQRFALQCMEERFWNNTMADYHIIGYSKTHVVSARFYGNFDFVRNHV